METINQKTLVRNEKKELVHFLNVVRWNVIDIGSECEIVDPSSNSGRVRCIHLGTNTIEKSMMSLLLPAIGFDIKTEHYRKKRQPRAGKSA